MLQTRHLALKLLAPTVLISLILVGACLFGTLFLNHLHVNASDVLSENVQSTQAAARLETTTKELLRSLRGDHQDAKALAEHVRDQTGWRASCSSKSKLWRTLRMRASSSARLRAG